ncbi:unnamed protein product [Heterobilharzia americana]|nr:unnamed protein product [Heterobilharzia americana]
MASDIVGCDGDKEASTELNDLRCLPDFAALCSCLTFFGADLGIHLTFPQLFNFLGLQDAANAKIWRHCTLGRFLLNHGLHIEGIQTAVEVLLNAEAVYDDKVNIFVQEGAKHVLPSYYKLPPYVRVKTLLCLLETQFDRNQPFKDKVNLRSPVDLRSPPLGVDVWGRSYWLLKDSDVNIYIYREDHQDNSFMLVCKSFDDMRELIEELKGAYSDNEKLEDILKKKQVSSDKADLKDQLTNLIQDGIASPEHEIFNSHKDSPVSLALTSSEDLKNTTLSSLPVDFQEPPIHSVDMLLGPSKFEHLIKTEEQKNEEIDHQISPNDHLNGSDEDHHEMPADDSKESNIDTSNEYQLKPECISDQVLKPEEDYSEQTNEYSQLSATEVPTSVLSNTQIKKSRKHSSSKSYSESAIGEQQDLRRSSRQRKPVQVFNIQPTQSKRVKISTSGTDSLSKTIDRKDSPKKQKIPAITIRLSENGHVVDKNQKRRKKRHRKKSRKGSNPWVYGTSSSDSDIEEDDSFEKALMQHLNVDSDNSAPCSPAKANKHLSTEWSDAPESDFDPDGLDVQSDVDSVTDGRNLARQKRLQKKFVSDSSTNFNEVEKEELCQYDKYFGDDDSECDDKKNKKGKVLRSTQSNNVNYVYNNSCSEEADDVASGSDSETKSADYNTDSGVDGRSRKSSARNPRLRPRRKMQHSRPRRVNFKETTFDDSESSGSESESPPCRTTRQRQVRYKMSEAFKQLDEALEIDEKYQEEKQQRLKRKSAGYSNEFDDENIVKNEVSNQEPSRSHGKDLSNILGPEWKESESDCRVQSLCKKRRIGNLSSNSSSEYSSNEDETRSKPGRSSKVKDEDFNPSSLEESESEDDADNLNCDSSDEVDQLSSDNSWLSTARRRSRNSRQNVRKRRNFSNTYRRSRKPVPRFEDSDEYSDRKTTRSRRCTRTVISYRESNDEASDDSTHNATDISTANKSKVRRLLDDDEDDAIGENNTDRSPTPISLSLKESRTQNSRRIIKSSSDSDYQPCDDVEEAEDNESDIVDAGELNGANESTLVITPIKKLENIETSQLNETTEHHTSSELIISETSDIDNSLFKDNVVSPVIVSKCCKEEFDNSGKMYSSDPLKNHVNGDIGDEEEVDDEVDECLPVRNFCSHISPHFDKNSSDIKPYVSPDLF